MSVELEPVLHAACAQQGHPQVVDTPTGTSCPCGEIRTDVETEEDG